MPDRITLDTDNPLSEIFSDARNAAGQSLEKISYDYYIVAKMQGDDSGSMGGIRINKSGRIEISPQDNKEKEFTRDMHLLLILNDIQQIELQLEDKYGEQFAEQLAMEHLDEDIYQKLMEIEDQDKRRREIALALKQGIEGGTIDPAALDDPQIREWIDARSQENEIKLITTLSVDKDIEAVNSVDDSQILTQNNALSSSLSQFM